MDSLPPEINLLIFNFLNYKSISRVYQVSSRWNKILKKYGEEIWQSICYIDDLEIKTMMTWKETYMDKYILYKDFIKTSNAYLHYKFYLEKYNENNNDLILINGISQREYIKKNKTALERYLFNTSIYLVEKLNCIRGKYKLIPIIKKTDHVLKPYIDDGLGLAFGRNRRIMYLKTH